MTQSILNSIKKLLGFDADYTDFDVDIMIHINSTFSTLHQLGVGPLQEFEIEGASETWTDFIGVLPGINSVKSYVYMKVRLAFDPPATSFHLKAMEDQIRELESRMNIAMEGLTRA